LNLGSTGKVGTMASTTVPNHHADHPGFAGPSGLLFALTMAWGRRRDARLAAELSGLGPDDDLVDIGCGPGAAARHAAGRARSVVGVDPAPVMLRVGRVVARHGASLRFVEGTAEHLPVADGAASVVWTIASVHHWQEIDAGVAEALRVLRPGGRFVAIERRTKPGATGIASHGWTPEQGEAFAGACAAAGFVDAAVAGNDAGGRRVAVVARRSPVG
jgi:ubiquinone/menaquinone biosynthesis C-methylase UbiE